MGQGFVDFSQGWVMAIRSHAHPPKMTKAQTREGRGLIKKSRSALVMCYTATAALTAYHKIWTSIYLSPHPLVLLTLHRSE